MARGLKFRILVVEELYYPYSENKGADQLRGYREADLGLCFRICKKPVFSQHGSYYAFGLHICTHLDINHDINTETMPANKKIANNEMIRMEGPGSATIR